jgi:hypothetical protein
MRFDIYRKVEEIAHEYECLKFCRESSRSEKRRALVVVMEPTRFGSQLAWVGDLYLHRLPLETVLQCHPEALRLPLRINSVEGSRLYDTLEMRDVSLRST